MPSLVEERVSYGTLQLQGYSLDFISKQLTGLAADRDLGILMENGDSVLLQFQAQLLMTGGGGDVNGFYIPLQLKIDLYGHFFLVHDYLV